MGGRSGAAAVGVVAAVAALGVAGCGGASMHTIVVGPTVAAHARFVAQATAVCNDVRRQEAPLKAREEALKRLPAAAAAAGFVPIAREVAAIARRAEERLRALPAPPVDAQAIAETLHAYTEETDDTSAIANASAHQENGLGEGASLALTKSVLAHLATAKSLGIGGCLAYE